MRSVLILKTVLRKTSRNYVEGQIADVHMVTNASSRSFLKRYSCQREQGLRLNLRHSRAQILDRFASMARKFPRLEPVGLTEGRVLRRKYRGNTDVERMLLEIAQVRQVTREIQNYFGCLHKIWFEENLGQRVPLKKIRLLLNEQALRRGALAGLKPPPRRVDPTNPMSLASALID